MTASFAEKTSTQMCQISSSSSFPFVVHFFSCRRAIISRPHRDGYGRRSGDIRFLTMGMCFFARTILAKRQYGCVDRNDSRTHFVGVAGSRRAFESCRVEPKQISKTSLWRSGRPTLVRFGRPKRTSPWLTHSGLRPAALVFRFRRGT